MGSKTVSEPARITPSHNRTLSFDVFGDDSQFRARPLIQDGTNQVGRIQHQFLEDPEGWIRCH